MSSTPEAQLQALIQETLESQLLFKSADPRAHLLAAKVVGVLTTNEATEGWLITGDQVRKVEETDFQGTCEDGESVAYTVYVEDDDTEQDQEEDEDE